MTPDRFDRDLWRDRLVIEIAKRVPYDLETVARVLELAPGANLRDPEEFLCRCSRAGLDPIEILEAIRRVRSRHENSGPPLGRQIRIRLRRSRGWILGAWVILAASLGALVGAIRSGSVLDAALCAALLAGAILILSVESRRLP